MLHYVSKSCSDLCFNITLPIFPYLYTVINIHTITIIHFTRNYAFKSKHALRKRNYKQRLIPTIKKNLK